MGAPVAGLSTAQQISLGSDVLGTGLGLLGTSKEASAEREASAFRMNILEQNKQILRMQEKQLLDSARESQQIVQLDTAARVADQRATQAGNNIVVDQDTALDTILDTVRLGRLDEIAISRTAQNQALALRMQGANIDREAQLETLRVSAVDESAKFAAVSTLIGGAGRVSSKWLTFTHDPATIDTDLDVEVFGGGGRV